MFGRRRPPILLWIGAFFFIRQFMRRRHGGYSGRFGGYGPRRREFV